VFCICGQVIRPRTDVEYSPLIERQETCERSNDVAFPRSDAARASTPIFWCSPTLCKSPHFKSAVRQRRQTIDNLKINDAVLVYGIGPSTLAALKILMLVMMASEHVARQAGGAGNDRPQPLRISFTHPFSSFGEVAGRSP